MKHLAYLLVICLAFAARAELMWQRNHGAWEAVVRVSKESGYYDFYDFRGVTNGYIYTAGTTNHYVESRAHITWSYWMRNAGSSSSYRPDTNGPYNTAHGWNVTTNTIDVYTNRLAQAANFRSIDSVEWYDLPITQIVPPRVDCGDLPCRFGVPQTIAVNLPYTDLMELLPLDYPETYIRIRTGFDGYLLLRFTEDEMRLTIKRLLPEKLPYEHPRRNIRVLRDDLLNGV